MAVITGQQNSTGTVPRRQTRVVQPSGRASMGAAGVLIVLLGAWGALVPFIGPLFGFSADGTGSWQWTTAHAWLFLVPGVVAVLGGLLVLSGGAGRAGHARLGGTLAMLAGAWFVIGPIAWPLLGQGTFFGGYSSLRQFGYWVGYALGTGVLLAILAGFVLGRSRAVTSTSRAVAASSPPVAYDLVDPGVVA